MAPPSQTVIDADWLRSQPIQAVFAALAAGGFTGRAVGGIVRNSLLGRAITDIDVATDALPGDVVRLASASGLKPIPTGIAHGTVTVMSAGVPVEVTTLRRDVATDGRHAEVAFTADWTADAARRDFTINAIYCDADGRIFDPLGGLADLHPTTRVRFIGSPTDRIREDYLRILRFFRFTAAFADDGAIDPAGLAACAEERGGLAIISGERIQAEMAKLLVARFALSSVAAMAASGVLAAVTVAHPRCDDLQRLIEDEQRLGMAPDAVRRLAAVLVSGIDDARSIDRRFKLSARDRERLRFAAGPDVGTAMAGTWAVTSPSAARARLYRLGVLAFTDSVLLSAARAPDLLPADRVDQLIVLARDWPVPTFPISGRDLMALGLGPGRMMGTLLAALEREWIASDFTLDATKLLDSARRQLARGGGGEGGSFGGEPDWRG